ncbi:MAG TPA: hypothetical protein VES68_03140 [Candidatus Sulfotelmatobacter sp.]|nr:hypothetical protein [Candidatus Sulfotelmatobacter sp.]
MKSTSEGGFESKFQSELHAFPNPSSLLEGKNIGDYLEKRKLISPFALTQPVSSLARSEEAADFEIPGLKKRLLVYPRTLSDDNAYTALREANIPQFTREIGPNPDIAVVKIPLNSWRLDSTDFQEQEPTFPAGNGAIEIMNKLGLLLNKIHFKTKTLPEDFQLCQVAYITGDNEFIRLIPPYSLSKNVNPEELIGRIEQDLNDIDPNNPHENQIKALRSSLFKTIK